MTSDAISLVMWFKARPLWIQEAAVRLLAKENLNPTDIQELAALCRKQVAEPQSSAKNTALSASAFAKKAAGAALRLNAIFEVKGIEALNPRTPLAFTQEPITIVYGGNGAGKSGYIRILNNVCGSKNRRKLLNNVFQGNAAQSCKIGYVINGTIKEITWQPSNGLQAELSALEIYDSECGQIYVSAENEVTFEPWLLGLFQCLVDACAAVDKNLETEIATLPSKKPTMPVEWTATSSATWYAQLTAQITTADVGQRCDWSPVHKEKLGSLQTRVLETNPAEQAKQLRTRKTVLEKFSTELITIAAGLCETTVQVLFDAKTNATLKRQAASEDAQKAFSAAPLEGIGLESWKLLWEQARAYSTGVAYVEKKFPWTEAESRCVLCQQPLDEEAKLRLISFEKFVKGELESIAQKAEATVEALLEKLPVVPSNDDFTVRLVTLGLDDQILTQKLHQFRDSSQAFRDSLFTATKREQVPPAPNAILISDLSVLSASLETKAKIFDDDAKKSDKTELKKQVSELEACKWLSEQKASIEDEIDRLTKVSALGAARKLTSTTALSTKKSDLAQALVSDAFIQRFEAELKLLSASRIQVELVQTKTTKGHVFHQIRLKNAKIVAPTAEVLSEGERRVVSLAAFIADVEGIEANTPFVFDDPISSLDQDFEESVVARLIALSKKRQVIVFTHRLSMLTQLEDVAKLNDLAVQVIALNRESWGTGQPCETPFMARKPEKVINGLLNDRIARARKILAENGKNEYDCFAKGICSDVRILVERLVEDTLLNEVIRRFRRSVHTQNKIGGLAKIKPQDCQLIDEFMTKYSRYEHSQPVEAPVSLPEPDEITADLTRLQLWLREFNERAIPQTVA